MSTSVINNKTGEVVKTSFSGFRTMFNHGDSKKFCLDLSNEEVDNFELDENNIPKVVGKTNVYKKIQEYKDSCDTYKILERYSSEEDFIADHNPSGGLSGDFTNIPTNMLDAMNNMDEAIAKWNSLPKDFRSLFGDNFSAFAKTSPEDMDVKLNLYAESKQPKKDKEGDE